ncbi:MAG: ATP-binding protein [Candidatus Eisenbacteria bacterium]
MATALESFKLRLEDAGFTLDVEVPEGLPLMRADGIALQHCLLNLLDNAVKYSRDRKEIRVFARARDGFVGLSVADRGIGIEPEHQGGSSTSSCGRDRARAHGEGRRAGPFAWWIRSFVPIMGAWKWPARPGGQHLHAARARLGGCQ